MYTFDIQGCYDDDGLLGRNIFQKILAPIKKPVRKVAAALAPLTGVGLFLQPEQMGIKSKSSQKIFDVVQKGGRIVAGTAAVVLTAGALAPAAGAGAGTAAAATGATAGGISAGTAATGAMTVGSVALKIVKGLGSAAVPTLAKMLVAKGVDDGSAPGLAYDMVNGQAPIPPDMAQQLQNQYGSQAGMFGGMNPATIVVLGVGVALAAVMIGNQSRGRG